MRTNSFTSIHVAWATRDMRQLQVAKVPLPWFGDLGFTVTEKGAERLSFKMSRRKVNYCLHLISSSGCGFTSVGNGNPNYKTNSNIFHGLGHSVL